MKIRVRKPGAKVRRLKRWHTWFAWYPVRVPTKGRMSGMTMVWLASVARKGRLYWIIEQEWKWEYKYKQK